MTPDRRLVWIWLYFLTRGLFYVSFIPLWEGFDEWAHYAVLQSTALNGGALVHLDAPVSREVQASLELAPNPWAMGGPKTALKQEGYWELTEKERAARSAQLRSLPPEWAKKPAEGGERSYEAQQAPLYYWLLSPVYRLVATLPLPTRVWLLRLVSLLIASFIIPLGFLAGRTVLGNDALGLMVATLIAAFPELMITVSRIANDSLAVALGSFFLLAILKWKQQPLSALWAAITGTTLGLALLTKGYFLALVPLVFLFGVILAGWKRAYRQLLVIFGCALTISAWWYWRNWTLTRSLSGEQYEVGRGFPGLNLVDWARRVDWRQAADFTFLSHIWLGDWSFLVVRSWMYHSVALVAGVAMAGLTVCLIRKHNSDLLLLLGTYLTFLLAMAYHSLRQFQSGASAGTFGHYLFAVVIAEAILLTAGLGIATPFLIFCLAGVELFGMTFLSIPYYTGFIAHLPNGNLPALGIGQLQGGGFATMLARLTVNKPPFLTPPVMAILWILFLAATFGLIAAAVKFASSGRRPVSK